MLTKKNLEYFILSKGSKFAKHDINCSLNNNHGSITLNGIIDLDDYNWSLENSPSLNPKNFSPSRVMYSEKQIKEKGVKMIIDGFIKNSRNYKEIVKNKAYMKIN